MTKEDFKALPFYKTHVKRAVLNTLVNEHVLDNGRNLLDELTRDKPSDDLSQTEKATLAKVKDAERKGTDAVWSYIFRKQVCCECVL